MQITIKVLPNADKNQWLGWFGENLLKVRLQGTSFEAQTNLISFIEKDLGIKPESFRLIKADQKHFYTFEMPDVAWELFLTAIEK